MDDRRYIAISIRDSTDKGEYARASDACAGKEN